MPFDPAPVAPPHVEEEVEIGMYQKQADALLRGCKLTRPAFNRLYSERLSAWIPFIRPSACALGAMALGLGCDMDDLHMTVHDRMGTVWGAYLVRYDSTIEHDNDYKLYSREQIAERIAAL